MCLNSFGPREILNDFVAVVKPYCGPIFLLPRPAARRPAPARKRNKKAGLKPALLASTLSYLNTAFTRPSDVGATAFGSSDIRI